MFNLRDTDQVPEEAQEWAKWRDWRIRQIRLKIKIMDKEKKFYWYPLLLLV